MAPQPPPAFFVCLKDIVLHDSGNGQGSILKTAAGSAVLCPLLLLLFLSFRSKFPQTYVPRTYLIPEDRRILNRDSSFLKRAQKLFTVSDDEVATKCGLDAYFFLRYVRSMLIAFTILAFVLIPVLLPVAYLHDSFEDKYLSPIISNGSVQRRSNSRLECRARHSNSSGIYFTAAPLEIPISNSTVYAPVYSTVYTTVYTTIYESLDLNSQQRSYAHKHESWSWVCSLTTDFSKTAWTYMCVYPTATIAVQTHLAPSTTSAFSLGNGNPVDVWKPRLVAAGGNIMRLPVSSYKTSTPSLEKMKSDDLGSGSVSVVLNNTSRLVPSNGTTAFRFYDLFQNCTTSRDNRDHLNRSLVSNRIVRRENSLDNFNFSNVPWNHPARYWAYLFMALLVVSLISWVILHETQVYVKYRTEWQISARHRAKPAASTVLFINIPTQNLTYGEFKSMVEIGSGSIQHIWINADAKDLDEFERCRRKMILEFEGAELDLLKKVHKAQWNKSLGNDVEQPQSTAPHDQSVGTDTTNSLASISANANSLDIPGSTHCPGLEAVSTDRSLDSSQSLSEYINLGVCTRRNSSISLYSDIQPPEITYIGLWKEWIKQKDRPQIGRKFRLIPRCFMRPFRSTDKIDYLRQKLCELHIDISSQRQKSLKCLPCVFVRYHRRDHAKLAAQRTYRYPIQVGYFEPVPHQILWKNLRPTSHFSPALKGFITWVVLLILIATWAVPVWLIGMITIILDRLENIDGQAPSKDKSPVLGYLTWIAAPLPPALIGVLMLNLPNFIFRPLARWQGTLTKSTAEIATQRMTFGFAFFQVFLVNLLSTGIVAWIGLVLRSPSIEESPANRFVGPSFWARLENISTSLSQTSRWCMSYLTYQALVNSISIFTQSGHLIWRAWTAWEKRTPRQMARRRFHMPQQRWAPSYALITVMACMVLTYSVAQPFVLLFGIASFGTLLLAYKYNVLYVWATRAESDGRQYPWALRHTFIGLYTLTVYMIVLFFTQLGCENNFACIPQAICMLFVLLFLIIFQLKIQRKYSRSIEWGTSGFPDGQGVDKFGRGHEGVHDFVKNGEEIVAWIPGNQLGVPEDECRAAPRGVQMVCEGSYIDDDGNIVVTDSLVGGADLCCKRY